MEPLVSICIPTYNGERYLGACIESALAQTYRNIEILIVDDLSADRTFSIADDYRSRDPRIRLVQNNHNMGLVGNWNNCVSLANGEWLKFLFHDDILEPSCIERMIRSCTPDASMVVCERSFLMDGCPSELKNHFLQLVTNYNMAKMFPGENYISPQKLNEAFLDNMMMNFVGEPTAVMLNRKVFTRFGMFNPHLVQYCDLEYWIRVGSNTGLVYVPETLAHFRLHAGGTTAANVSGRKFRVLADKVICYHEFLFHPDYSQLRCQAAEKEPFTNLRQLFAAEIKQVRKMAVDASMNRPHPNLGPVEELKEISRLYPGIRFIKKIPLSSTYERYRWKVHKFLRMCKLRNQR